VTLPPTTSVVIPCYNAARWIRETIGSVVSQDCGDLQVIVVDDGSTDATAEIVRQEFAFVRLVTTPNRGPSAARNLGFSLSSGEFIQYLDADDLLAPGKIRWQRDLLRRSGADVAYGDWQWLLPSAEGFVPGPTITGVMTDPELDLFDANLWWPVAAYFFRRSIIDKTGGWNETLPLAEDERFVVDCAVQGGKFTYSPGIVAHYRRVAGSTGKKDWILSRQCRYRNALEIEAAWRARGELTAGRQAVLAQCLDVLARACSETDPPTSRAALDHLEQLVPGYVPRHSLRWNLASRLVGFRRAVAAAPWYRRLKRLVMTPGLSSGA
jgi:glycosyltransferase involved in cell wall biosynthesis